MKLWLRTLGLAMALIGVDEVFSQQQNLKSDDLPGSTDTIATTRIA